MCEVKENKLTLRIRKRTRSNKVTQVVGNIFPLYMFDKNSWPSQVQQKGKITNMWQSCYELTNQQLVKRRDFLVNQKRSFSFKKFQWEFSLGSEHANQKLLGLGIITLLHLPLCKWQVFDNISSPRTSKIANTNHMRCTI